MAIFELSEAISCTFDRQAVVNKVAELALRLCGADEVSIMIPSKDRRELYVVAELGRSGHPILGACVPMPEA
ncbi:MAG: hypothetical protein AB2L14_20295 [Candidatus Xenobiia bacterium LiM19]